MPPAVINTTTIPRISPVLVLRAAVVVAVAVEVDVPVLVAAVVVVAVDVVVDVDTAIAPKVTSRIIKSLMSNEPFAQHMSVIPFHTWSRLPPSRLCSRCIHNHSYSQRYPLLLRFRMYCCLCMYTIFSNKLLSKRVVLLQLIRARRYLETNVN